MKRMRYATAVCLWTLCCLGCFGAHQSDSTVYLSQRPPDIRQESGESEQHKPGCLCDQCLITRWRSRKISVEQAEREIELDKWTPECQAKWKTFLSKLRPDCELWYYCSPGQTWEKLAGREGYAIFDNDRLVADIVTRMN